MNARYRNLLKAGILSLSLMGLLPGAQAAQAYPENPINMIIPFPPGGGTDTMARLLSTTLTQKFGWNVVDLNRPGAGGTVGLGTLARAPKDGYTMALGQTSNLSINPYLYNKIPYEVARDFAPVVSVAAQPMVLVTRADRPYKSVAELVEYAKAHPGKLTVANAGIGTVGDVTGRYFAKMAGLDVLHVPFKGASPAMTDLLGGRADIFFASAPAAQAQLHNPDVRMLAITNLESIPQFPDVPPLADTLPGFESASKTGVLVPVGTPPEIIDLLNEKINEALKDKDLHDKIVSKGNIVLGGSVQDFADTIHKDSEKWSAIIDEAGLKASN